MNLQTGCAHAGGWFPHTPCRRTARTLSFSASWFATASRVRWRTGFSGRWKIFWRTLRNAGWKEPESRNSPAPEQARTIIRGASAESLSSSQGPFASPLRGLGVEGGVPRAALRLSWAIFRRPSGTRIRMRLTGSRHETRFIHQARGDWKSLCGFADFHCGDDGPAISVNARGGAWRWRQTRRSRSDF